MHARERIIRERFAAQSCAQCGRQRVDSAAGSAAVGGLLILARRRDTWLVLVTCGHCDHRGIYVVTFTHSAHPDAADWQAVAHDEITDAMEVHALTSSSLAAAAATGGAVTMEDVSQMRAFLQSFDGDFRRIFAES